MPFVITGIIALILFIGGASMVNKTQTHSLPPAPTTIIQEISTTSPTLIITPNLIETLTPTLTSTPIPTVRPTPLQTHKPIATSAPAKQIFIPTSIPVPMQTNKSSFQCNCSKTCPNMATCEEAYFQLVNCGCSKRDGDKDGVPCEDICSGG